MKLLQEYFRLCPNGICNLNTLTEEERRLVKEEDTYFLQGIIQCADTKNGNGRIYPKKTLLREIENYQKLINESRAIGALDHDPDEVVLLQNASHVLEKVWWDGNNVMGKIRVLNHTPNGKTLKGLLKDRIQVGISSRALGSVQEMEDYTLVEEDLQLLCFDIVHEPSTPNAFLMREWKNPKKQIWEKSDRIYRKINSILMD